MSSIEVTGTTHLNSDQVVALSGLKTGHAIPAAELDAAVKRLLDTGLVTAAHYRLQSTPSGVRLTLEVVEPLWTMAVLLDNFIWFSDEEIYRTIAREIPTFDGAVPDTEAALNTVARVLQGMLDERKIAGRVEQMRSVELSVGRQKERYTVTGITMPLCSIRFLGASRPNEVELLKATQFMVGAQYSRERLFKTIDRGLTVIYKQRGYLEAEFHAPKVVRQATPACDGGVDASIDVQEGAVFALGAVEWVGNTGVPTAALATVAPKIGKIGERVDFEKLETGLAAARDVYLQKGFLDVALSPTFRLDRAARTATYHVEIAERAQYRMGSLTEEGLAPSDAARVAKAWPIPTGAPFDLLAARGFPAKATKAGLVPAGFTLVIQMPLSAYVVDVKLVAKPKAGRFPIS